MILISLDGAGASTFHELYQQGVFRQGGFERFFRDGEVASALRPVDPTLTATNHISLATGFPPAVTGIVGNQFHPGGAPSPERANGFQAPVETETLWESVRRQGRRAGVLTWPGADAEGERRTADWGLVYNNTAELGPRILTLSRADWEPVPSDSNHEASNDSALSARVVVGDETAADAQSIDLVAVDSTDDGKANYDTILVTTTQQPGNAPPSTVSLHIGEWGRVTWPRAEGPAASWLKLLDLKPDLASARLFMDGIYSTIAYPGELAESLAAHDLYWPGPPDNASLLAAWQGKTGIDLDTWTEQAEHMAAFMGETLRLAVARSDWDLIMCYIPVIDMAGHRLLLLDDRQSGFSPDRRDELARARSRVWQAIDAELRKLMASLDLTRTTLVVVSDHGMMPVHTAIDPNVQLAELGVLSEEASEGGSVSRPGAYAIADGGAAHVYLEAGGDAQAGEHILADLTSRYTSWRVDGEAVIENILHRQEAARAGIDHPNSGDMILFAREGYVFRSLPEGRSAAPAPVYGAHGHLGTHQDMQGIYMAIGAGIEPSPTRTTVQATEIASRVAAWLGIDPPGREIARAKQVDKK